MVPSLAVPIERSVKLPVNMGTVGTCTEEGKASRKRNKRGQRAVLGEYGRRDRERRN